eukprot:7026006-Alexandrium_andersonii.AAC.1
MLASLQLLATHHAVELPVRASSPVYASERESPRVRGWSSDGRCARSVACRILAPGTTTRAHALRHALTH